MNLQLNLVLESELRSGRRISRKFVAHVLAVGVSSVIVFMLIFLVLAGRQARHNLAAARAEQRQLDPLHKAVVELDKDLALYQSLLQELQGWRASRLDWYEMVTELQRITPANIQFTRLTVNERIDAVDSKPARHMLMMLTGKAVGKNAREDVQLFDSKTKNSETLTSLISSMEVRLLGTASHSDEPDVCLFDATYTFVPRKITGQH